MYDIGTMPVQTVDETAAYTEMQGPSSGVNQLAGRGTLWTSPTKSLIALWVFVLILYWLLGALFRRFRA
jgi:hypothetical protein